MYRIIICTLLLSGAMGIVIRDSVCDWQNTRAVTNLNLTGLLGEWHQMKRIENSMESGACSTLSIDVSNNSVTVQNREVHEKTAHITNGRITFINEMLGLFRIEFPEVTSYDTVVVATDYSQYALLYSCMNLNENQSSVVAWVYSRNTSLQLTDQVIVQTFINANEDLRNATWIETLHTDEACSVSGSITFKLSPILAILAIIFMGKGYFVSN